MVDAEGHEAGGGGGKPRQEQAPDLAEVFFPHGDFGSLLVDEPVARIVGGEESAPGATDDEVANDDGKVPVPVVPDDLGMRTSTERAALPSRVQNALDDPQV
jgi:hypothetical protein